MALGLPAAHQGSGQALQEGVDKANVMQMVPLSCTLRLVGNHTRLQLLRLPKPASGAAEKFLQVKRKIRHPGNAELASSSLP